MPKVKRKVGQSERTFDARPDRTDLRDRIYQPRLISLPPEYPPPRAIAKHLTDYCTAGLVLDQGSEGACTGFGLAACVNYLFWEQSLKVNTRPHRVSPYMFYHLARIYDEWPGEDYEGSSCRGGMKGWHRHGACVEPLWGPTTKRKSGALPGWDADAATRPLGAYYRIDRTSIVDMQSAINEVHAIYVSADVHDGWAVPKSTALPVIRAPKKAPDGGHAFAVVGYNSVGFIIQNSWGPDWGFRGFAVLPYADWLANGTDAWVAVLGAPVAAQDGVVKPSPKTLTSVGQQQRAAAPAVVRARGLAPLPEDGAYRHTVVLGNDGLPLHRRVDAADAAADLQHVVRDAPAAWMAETGLRKIAIYAHGGLNDEAASIRRIQAMAPYFTANGIYPLFITWRTGIAETIADMLHDAANRQTKEAIAQAGGILTTIGNLVDEAKDRALEVFAQNLLAKAVWTQMKQNAEAAATLRDGGLVQVSKHLKDLSGSVKNVELHLIGHSAGAILHGHLLDRLGRVDVSVASATLFAPACTVAFAERHYGAALDGKVLPAKAFRIENLSDAREQDDTVGPYCKSLLYLVSRALEQQHKTPLLGLDAAWSAAAADADEALFHADTLAGIRAWLARAGKLGIKPLVHTKPQVSDGRNLLKIAHGTFDNDIDVVGRALAAIAGRKLAVPVADLSTF